MMVEWRWMSGRSWLIPSTLQILSSELLPLKKFLEFRISYLNHHHFCFVLLRSPKIWNPEFSFPKLLPTHSGWKRWCDMFCEHCSAHTDNTICIIYTFQSWGYKTKSDRSLWKWDFLQVKWKITFSASLLLSCCFAAVFLVSAHTKFTSSLFVCRNTNPNRIHRQQQASSTSLVRKGGSG